MKYCLDQLFTRLVLIRTTKYTYLFKSNGISHYYQLEQSIYYFRDVLCFFQILKEGYLKTAAGWGSSEPPEPLLDPLLHYLLGCFSATKACSFFLHMQIII